MRRKAIAHSSVGLGKKETTRHGVLKALTGKGHQHTCVVRACGRTYTCNCIYPAINGRCGPCIHPAGPGRRRNKDEDEARDPRPCCVNNTALVTDAAELLRYELAGPGPWFKCNTCARCHGRAITTLKETQ